MSSCLVLENYFATLMVNTGAKSLILQDDSAGSTMPLKRRTTRMYKDLQKQQQQRQGLSSVSASSSTNSGSFGPPSCPLRKASVDNLGAMIKNKKAQLQQQHQHQQQSSNQTWKLNSGDDNKNTTTTDKNKSICYGRGSLFREMASDVLLGGESPFSSPIPGRRSLSLSSLPPVSPSKRQMEEYINEVEAIVGWSTSSLLVSGTKTTAPLSLPFSSSVIATSSSSSMTKREARWVQQ